MAVPDDLEAWLSAIPVSAYVGFGIILVFIVAITSNWGRRQVFKLIDAVGKQSAKTLVLVVLVFGFLAILLALGLGLMSVPYGTGFSDLADFGFWSALFARGFAQITEGWSAFWDSLFLWIDSWGDN